MSWLDDNDVIFYTCNSLWSVFRKAKHVRNIKIRLIAKVFGIAIKQRYFAYYKQANIKQLHVRIRFQITIIASTVDAYFFREVQYCSQTVAATRIFHLGAIDHGVSQWGPGAKPR